MEEIRKIKLNAEGLDPKLVKEKVAQKKEELKRTEKVTRAEAKEKALKVMREVGIDEPEKKVQTISLPVFRGYAPAYSYSHRFNS